MSVSPGPRRPASPMGGTLPLLTPPQRSRVAGLVLQPPATSTLCPYRAPVLGATQAGSKSPPGPPRPRAAALPLSLC